MYIYSIASIRNERQKVDEYLASAAYKEEKTEVTHQFPHSNLNSTIYSTNYSTFYPLINVVLDNTTTTGSKNSVFHWENFYHHEKVSIRKLHNFPLFFAEQNIIRIPKKTKYAVMHLIPKKKLKKIHSDILVAQELCLLFLSQLSSTYYEYIKEGNLNGWKSLYSPYLRKLLLVEKNTYILIREALETHLDKGPLIECDYIDIQGKKSFNYRLGPAYLGKGIDSYELKTDMCRDLYKKRNESLYTFGESNIIYNNLIKFYSTITLPTLDDIKYHARGLTEKGYVNKKGKTLKFLNKHAKSYYTEPNKISFVEDGIEIYKSLTNGGLIIPHIGDERSGGRVTDSLNLMPSWIRQLITINGERLVECDFSCFHPNIAISLYGGSGEYLTHNDVSEKAGVDISVVKLAHLKFFNMHPKQMEKSPLFDFYCTNEYEMIKSILRDKNNSEYKYKITSMNMFQKEVEIMTEAIRILNSKGIYVGYIYDALLCQPKHLEDVKKAMEEAAAKFGVKAHPKESMLN